MITYFMGNPLTNIPPGNINILFTDTQRFLEISSDTTEFSLIPIRLDNREVIDYLICIIKEKKWVKSENPLPSGGIQYKLTVPGIYLKFFESAAGCNLHNDGHRTAFDALKVWHAQGSMDSDELDDIMTMFE